ncbi:receptor-like serine/threonine-protein kinase NCRK isoform X1 [Pyrus x bretschneideri]|uniref:receptor-like serine/threonine-protein kinase NCRK isoform X1 n=1 Tax=Pyrus x bretschneideri TaxID=225117 RepID=UPI002030DDF8|nr:receptor-like serine/threonine-protein kinase NCRK isoform X1 [Pyrus x bretschneideri]XP_048444882.1 receptor-like serine/threonine-protein kinase NCRK isoform X1 [Pyrus x bretschneideri]XP_048444883.1 receptor-like serine/threonine-protein kinase NCRK isoform X1 [Pyrus x bretschneideri]
MKFQVKVALACVITLIVIQQGVCADEVSGSWNATDWTCRCSYQGNVSYTLEPYCSASCNCSKDAGSNTTWTCICAANGLPKVAADGHDPNCFTACNCTYGSLNAAQPSKNHFSSKVVVIILLACVILTTLAFISSVACYFCRRAKCSIQAPIFSPDKESSCNSASNLISYKSSSLFETKINMDSPISKGTGTAITILFHLTGCFTSCILRSKPRATPGAIVQFSYFELESATNKFSDSNLIGLGGSSYVYRGQLNDGEVVAVKRLKALKGPDMDSVFLTEIEMLARLNHFNVVPLLGYCFETHGKNVERLLIFEYMDNGNLRDCLDGDEGKNMDWVTRVSIAIGAARGLEYLHEAAAPRILHRDVKSTNILLDENWQAKITDLGMAKRLKADGVPSTSSSPARMQGTFGYFAPEYAIAGRASLESDVFSFGVVLLELITGRKPIHKSTTKGEESLVIWAMPRLLDSRRVITELADPDLNGNFPEEEMQIMAYLAKECLLLDPDARPNMSEVVQILSTISPERSKRKNFSVNLFQHIGMDGHKDAEEIRRAKSSKGSVRCSLPLDIDRNLCAERDTHSVSDNMERLILLTSNARSCRANDIETVDLTEPRLESFCVTNGKPP